MKRKLSFIVLLGLVMGAVLVGCKPQETPPPADPAVTNAVPAEAP